MNGAVFGGEQAEQAGVYREDVDGGSHAVAQEALDAVVIHAKLIAEGEDVLLDLAGLAIEYQNIISIGAGVLLQTERVIQE